MENKLILFLLEKHTLEILLVENLLVNANLNDLCERILNHLNALEVSFESYFLNSVLIAIIFITRYFEANLNFRKKSVFKK